VPIIACARAAEPVSEKEHNLAAWIIDSAAFAPRQYGKTKKMHVRLQKVHGMTQPGGPIVRPMNAQTPATTAPKPRRIRAALIRAIDAIAIDGQSQKDAARRAGMHETALSKALAKPHVAAVLEQRKALAAMEATQLKGIARSMAIRVGIDLMQNATSEQVRAKMVEFFAGESKQSGVAVQVNVGPNAGYIYARPDPQSEPKQGQAIELTAKDVTPDQ
jgi:hypothetical protein